MITTTCSICFKKFQSYPSQKRRFCSSKCMHSWRVKKVFGSHPKSIKKRCVTCRNFFWIRNSHASDRINCSLKCMGVWRSKFQRGKASSNWKGGVSQLFAYGIGFTNKLKKEILMRDKNNCRVCGRKKFLNVHHRDGVKTHNVKMNLISLCPKCHRTIHRKFEAFITRKYGFKERKNLNKILLESIRKYHLDK